jgi:molybdopterin molybdotransferase
METSLSAGDAARRIVAALTVQPTVRVPLDDALGLVLAHDVTSPIDIPAYANSAMDGYACRADDVRGASDTAPVRLRVVEQVPAGTFPTRAIGPGECARIFTGAPLPEGADSVVRQEDTDEGTDVVTIVRDRDAGVNVRFAGEDLRRGALALAAGTPLGPAHLGVLASLAEARPYVHRRPRIGILGSGDEIAAVTEREAILSGRKIASSNTHTLIALVKQAGGEPVNLGVAHDTAESMREHLRRAEGCDLLVTTAGISVGEHDHVRGVLESMGAAMKFWKLRMRPGAPVGFGLVGAMPWIGLPGNPVSTMVTFELFVRPAIRAMLGHRLPFRAALTARAAEPIVLKPKLQHFLRGVVTDGPEGPEARLAGPQGSGILTSMVRANALLIIPEGQFETPAGASVTALPFTGTAHQEQPPFR